jgi:hypothetical protein
MSAPFTLLRTLNFRGHTYTIYEFVLHQWTVMSLASFDSIHTRTSGPCKFETKMKRMDHPCRYHACDLDNVCTWTCTNYTSKTIHKHINLQIVYHLTYMPRQTAKCTAVDNHTQTLRYLQLVGIT